MRQNKTKPFSPHVLWLFGIPLGALLIYLRRLGVTDVTLAKSPGAHGRMQTFLAGLTRGCCRASLHSGLRPHRSWSSGTRGTSGPSLRECSLVSSPLWCTCQPYTTGKGGAGDVRKVPIARQAKNPKVQPQFSQSEQASYTHKSHGEQKELIKLQEPWVSESENFRNWRELYGA